MRPRLFFLYSFPHYDVVTVMVAVDVDIVVVALVDVVVVVDVTVVSEMDT